MKFTIVVHPRGDSPIYYENEDIKVCVGGVGRDSGQHVLHHGVAASNLKPPALAEFRKFGKEQVQLMNLTQRMLK